MVNKGALIIRFVGDARDLNKTTVKVSKNMSGMSKMGLGLAAGVGAVIAGVGALAVATGKDLMRVETLGKQTAAIIKATGGAANRTVAQVNRQADSLEKMTGVEREVVTEGQNMLLTFKNIKGREFDEATRAALDMGVAMNKGKLEGLDLQSSSIRLGKALNDPIKGISALSKVGVSFSDKQKEMIKNMVKTGDVAGAQKVILKELKSEFGGAAKAAGNSTEGMMAKIKNSVGNISEEVFSFLLPAMATVIKWVNEKVMPAMVRFGDWLKNDGARHLKAFGGWLQDNVLPPLQTLGGFLVHSVVPALVSLGKWLVKNREVMGALAVGLGVALVAWKAYIFFTVGVPAIISAITLAQKGLNAALKANPIGIVITVIAALVAALVWFFTKTKVGKAVVAWAWKGIKAAIKGVADWWTKTAWPAIKGALKSMGDWFKSVARGAGRAWHWMSESLGNVWRWIKKNVIDNFVLGIKVWGFIFKSVGRKVGGYFSSLKDRLASAGYWIRKNVFDRIGTALHAMRDAFRNAKDAIGRIWDGLKKKAAVPVNFVIDSVYNNGIRKAINALPGTQGLKEVPKIRFARGGGVFGGVPGRDSVNSLLMPGEHVLTSKEVRKLGGQAAVYKMRKAIQSGEFSGAGDLPAFAKGGGFTGGRIAEAQAFAKRQSGKPYGWGAVGPDAYDCSGFMSALTNVLQGQSPHRRRGATADFPWGGFKRGIGQFTVGSSKNFSGGIGHMAGNLAGMGVESRGGRGVIVGSGAMATSRFNSQYHLGAGGLAASKAGGFWDAIQTVVGIFKKIKGWQDSLSRMGDWSGLVKQVVRGVANEARGFVNNTIPGPGPIPRKFAKGGLVRARAGGTHIIAGEAGYDEAIVPMGGPYAPSGGRARTVQVNLDGEFGKWLLKTLRRLIGDNGGDVQIVLGRGRARR